MKRVQIYQGQKALVFKNRELQRILSAGKHWVGFGETIEIFETNKEFKSKYDLKTLLANQELAELLHVIDVQENEIVICYVQGKFERVLNTGLFAFWKENNNYTFTVCDVSKVEITENVDFELLKRAGIVQYIRVVRVENYQKALLFVDEKLSKILTGGTYYFWKNEIALEVIKSDFRTHKIEIWGYETFEANKEFKSKYDLKTLLENQELAEQLHVVDVKDRQVVLCFADGKFVRVLTAGLYAFWKNYYEYTFTVCDLSKAEITENIDFDMQKRVDLVQYIRMVHVESYQKALLFIDGKLSKTLTGGTYYFWKNDIALEVMKADLRTQQIEISGQEILSKDKAALRVNYEVQYKVVDVESALMQNADYQKQLYVFVQLALRGYIGSLTLDELLENRQSVSANVQAQIAEKAQKLGVEVINSGLKDIILTGEMKEIMNRVLIAQKQAEANVITRREETASTRSLLNTAKLMEDNSMLFKLKEMEYIEKIAEKINNISVSGGGQIASQLKELFGST